MQKEDGNKNLLRSNTRNQRQQIKPRREIENRRVRDKIYGKDAIENGRHLSLLPNHSAFLNSVKERGSDGALRSQPSTLNFSAHCGNSVPACSATMYLAYQSGQFASLSPVRFSCSPWAASARRSALDSSLTELKVVAAESIRPGRRVVISWSSQRFPSGSSNEANEK